MSDTMAESATLPQVQLYHGDCLEVMPTLAKGSVAMAFSDLPYGILKHRAWDLPVPLCDIWRCLHFACSANAAFIFSCNMLLASRLIASNTPQFRYDLIWQKTYASNFLLAKKRPLCVHEHILLFADPKHRYNPQMRPESERTAIVNKVTAIKNQAKWHASNFFTKCTRNGPMYPIGIIKTKESRKGKLHPTQKPVALLEWLIKTYTDPGDTVLDPAFGSCTTGVACLRTGRNFIGIEKDATYFAVGKARVEAEQARMTAT